MGVVSNPDMAQDPEENNTGICRYARGSAPIFSGSFCKFWSAIPVNACLSRQLLTWYCTVNELLR